MKRINILILSDEVRGTYDIFHSKAVQLGEDTVMCYTLVDSSLVTSASIDYLDKSFDIIVYFGFGLARQLVMSKLALLKETIGHRFIDGSRLSKQHQQVIIKKFEQEVRRHGEPAQLIHHVPTTDLVSKSCSGFAGDTDMVVVKEQHGACGVTQLLLPYRSVFPVLYDMEDYTIKELMNRHPNLRINAVKGASTNMVSPRRSTSSKDNELKERVLLKASDSEMEEEVPITNNPDWFDRYGLVFDVNNLIVQPFIDNIRTEWRVIVSGEKKFYYSRPLSTPEGGFRHANLLGTDGVTALIPDTAPFISERLAPAVDAFVRNTGLLFGSLDLALTTDDKLYMLEFSSEFGMKYMTTSEVNDIVFGFSEALAARYVELKQ